MSASVYPRHGGRRPTDSFSLPQRAAIRFFRRVAQVTIGIFLEIGWRVHFLREIMRAVTEPRTWLPLTIK